MEYLIDSRPLGPVNGFLGTGATFAADVNFIVQLAMGGALSGRGDPGETEAIQSSRYLPNDGVALEPVDDRVDDVALIPTAACTTYSPESLSAAITQLPRFTWCWGRQLNYWGSISSLWQGPNWFLHRCVSHSGSGGCK
jgi:hypothetical protein